jgi:hypothetical protein
LALRTKDAAVGSNLVAVWYLPPAAGTQQWSAKTWDTTEHWDAIKTIKESLSIADGSDELWPTTDQLQPWNAPKVASGYSKGFKQGDVLLAALDSLPNRDQVLDAFTGWGYKSANPSFEKTSNEYSTDAFLSGVKSAFEATYAAIDSTLESSWTVFSTQMTSVLGADVLVGQDTTVPPPIPPTLPSNCKYLRTNPTWAPGEITRDPQADQIGICAYNREHYIPFHCREGNWFIKYDKIYKFTWGQKINCPNRNNINCPVNPSCAFPMLPSFPPSGTVIIREDYYTPAQEAEPDR